MLFTVTALQLLVALRFTMAAPANYDGESMLNARELSPLGHQQYSRDLEFLSARDISTLGVRSDNIYPSLVGRGSRSCTPEDKKDKKRAEEQLRKSKEELKVNTAKWKKCQENEKNNKDPKRKRFFAEETYSAHEMVKKAEDDIEYWQSCVS